MLTFDSGFQRLINLAHQTCETNCSLLWTEVAARRHHDQAIVGLPACKPADQQCLKAWTATVECDMLAVRGVTLHKLGS